MRFQNSILFICLWLISIVGYAQKDRGYFQRLNQQYDPVRQEKEVLFSNPAFMSGYSIYSFSDFDAGYGQHKKKTYLLQEGNQSKGIQVKGSSFKRLKNNSVLWGEVVYQDKQHKGVQWNSSLDLDYIGPYVLADSTKGTNKYESYAFMGGVAKQVSNWRFGAEMSYKAQMAHRDRDPRPKATTSDLKLKAGIAYNLYKDIEIGTFAELTSYKQSTDVKFFNQTGRASLYQMTGLGEYSFYFSNKTQDAHYNYNGIHTGVSIVSHEDIDFGLVGYFTHGKLDKQVSSQYDINRLENKQWSIDAFKGFTIGRHRLLAHVVFSFFKREGTDILYTNIDTNLDKLMERKAYKKSIDYSEFSVMYQWEGQRDFVSFKPFYIYQKEQESMLLLDRNQSFTYGVIGGMGEYRRMLSSKSVLTLSTSVQHRAIIQANNQLNTDLMKPSIGQWLESDYLLKSSNCISSNLSVRYDHQLASKLGLYTLVEYQQEKYSEFPVNQYMGVRLGITF
ncbi:DUF6850 family outer membrane beta-barrel protein [Myroides pelagicus]|uniref:DUF6850 domain-containing protein n=1 Tax=Myroides pelagicus TaxID=270914 RepID=A0A7K1GK67_9FLAO|nr:DUF6850 family outer membrane beta-barrel protein [Myroides pelagicus]MTH29282.1 hypothetical protein [Myroides pelagicus]